MGFNAAQNDQNGGIGVGPRPFGVGPSLTHPGANPLNTSTNAWKVRRFQRRIPIFQLLQLGNARFRTSGVGENGPDRL
ncbi:hypothetical protein [Burkholderia stagnalis]|uniref:hypothetical protein n=1 Tax=Burkholderia stagnalis TaxID=1503054 RepID=UPI000F5AA48C|nr:hypothetical protein [Burkholderia stagnalis]